MTPEEPFREMTPRERALIARLLERDFPGRDALRTQLATARVQPRHPDQDESIAFEIQDGVPAPVLSNLPILAYAGRGPGIPSTQFQLFVGKDGLAHALENIRDSSQGPPAIEDIHVWYQQKNCYLYLPPGSLVPDYVPDGLVLHGASHSTDFDLHELPSALRVAMRPTQLDEWTPHVVIEQLRNYAPSAPIDAHTLNLRSQVATWWTDGDFLKLEWGEAPGLLIHFQAKGLPLEELIAVAESLRPAKSTG